MTETVNHPPHYRSASPMGRPILELLVNPELFEAECIEVIEQINANFLLGNAIKYLWRVGQKGSLIEDLKKARWYLERLQQQPRLCGQGRHIRQAIEMIDEILNKTGEG